MENLQEFEEGLELRHQILNRLYNLVSVQQKIYDVLTEHVKFVQSIYSIEDKPTFKLTKEQKKNISLFRFTF